MRREATRFAVTLLAAALLFVGCAGPGKKGSPPRGSKKAPRAAVLCPVSGKSVGVPRQALSSTYEGKRYYFCSPEHKAKFDSDPEKYLKKK